MLVEFKIAITSGLLWLLSVAVMAVWIEALEGSFERWLKKTWFFLAATLLTFGLPVVVVICGFIGLWKL